MKKFEDGNRIYNVITMDEYTNNPSRYQSKYTAIETSFGMVYPLRSCNDKGPGIYYEPGAMACYVEKPVNPELYSAERIIDFSNPANFGELIAKYDLIKDIEKDIISNTGNITVLPINEGDTPASKALKEALNAKCINISDYAPQFPNFNNDFKVIKGNSVTLPKLTSFCSIFGIDATLILRDVPDCPNPMNKEIVVNLTDNNNGGEI